MFGPRLALVISLLGILVSVSLSNSGALAFAAPQAMSYDGYFTLTGVGPIRFSPPTLADLNGDSKKEILVGTADGWVYALRYDAASATKLSLLWSHNTAVEMGCATGIRGAVSVGNLNGDGVLKVVVPIGDVATSHCGGLMVLEGSTGNFVWKYASYDLMTNTTGSPTPDGISDGVVSTPALGDLDNDGKLEIVFAGFDMRVYAFRADGSLMSGWPRFVRDCSYSSPALADIDNDGLLEIIVGVDTHSEASPFNTINGGYVYVFRNNGTTQPGWPQATEHDIQSSPAVGDINGDGNLEIVVGSGELYNVASNLHVYAYNAQGTKLWSGTTSNDVMGSPALGDINGDGRPEVLVGSKDSKLYAWNGSGTALWSTTVQDALGNVGQPGSPISFDWDADGIPDAAVNTMWSAAIIKGTTGAQLTANAFPSDVRPYYMSNYTTQDNATAVGDLDGDGKLELVLASASGSTGTTGQVTFWRLTANVGSAMTVPWPMFGQNAAHTRLYPRSLAWDAEIVSHTLPAVLGAGEQRSVSITLRNTGTSSWTSGAQIRLGAVGNSDPFTASTRLSLNAGETVAPGTMRTFTWTMTAPSTQGYYTSDWRMVNDASSTWFGRLVTSDVKVGGQPALHVLTTQNMYAGGLATTAFSAPWLPTGFSNWSTVRLWKLTYDKRGYQMFDTFGGYWVGGVTLPLYPIMAYNSSSLQDMVVGPDLLTNYELLSNGTIEACTPSGCSVPSSLSGVPTGIQARALALTADGKGVYVVDGAGNLYRGGNAPAMSLPTGLPITSGDTDIIRRIKLTPSGTGFYVMDKYGNVRNGGNAPTLAPSYTPQTGQDWARDFELTHDGTGFYLLAKTGAIYVGGAATPLTVNVPPTSANDIARDLELVDTRVPAVPTLQVGPSPAVGRKNVLQSGNALFTLTVTNGGGVGSINWFATLPTNVSLNITSGTVSTSPTTLNGWISNVNGYGVGTYAFGNIVVTGTDSNGNAVAGSPQTVPVSLLVTPSISLPLVAR